MMGRLELPDSGAGDPKLVEWATGEVTPAATAPSTDVFTKSRREKVTKGS
jgi:hypothetical protein